VRLQFASVTERVNGAAIVEKVCLSASAVQRRLRRLREKKIIERDVAIVSPEALGRSAIAIVEVTLDTSSASSPSGLPASARF
jgi:Lrp/AsnC family leucine-responsive transcriptional regulator